jgi:hypothetical protein
MAERYRHDASGCQNEWSCASEVTESCINHALWERPEGQYAAACIELRKPDLRAVPMPTRRASQADLLHKTVHCVR